MAILQAGDHRTASPNSWLMIHDGQAEDGKIDTRDVDALKKITDNQKWQYYNILAEKSLLSPKNWEEKCRTDFWMSATDAQELGLIDEVK
jgi:ATP-dependent protease ClpP protease subunit